MNYGVLSIMTKLFADEHQVGSPIEIIVKSKNIVPTR